MSGHLIWSVSKKSELDELSFLEEQKQLSEALMICMYVWEKSEVRRVWSIITFMKQSYRAMDMMVRYG